MLAVARGRRRPARWLLPALGIALAAAFAAGVAAQSQIAGDQSARSVLGGASPLDSQVRVTWPGAARRSDRASCRDRPIGPVAPRPLARPAGSLPPAALSDAARRRRPTPEGLFNPGRDRRQYPGRRLVAAALGGPPGVRAVDRGLL